MLVFLPPAKCWKIRFWRLAKNRYFLITNPFEKLQFSACRRGGGTSRPQKGRFSMIIFECIQCEAGMHTLWGLNVYSTRLEDIQHEVWKYIVYSMTVYEAWKYTLWGLKVYTIRPECIQHEAWKYTLWGLNVCSITFESIHYEAWKYTVRGQ